MRITLPLVLLALLAASGCAALPNTSYDDRIDTKKVASIDRQSKLHNIEVHWVNMPLRKPDAVPLAVPVVPTGT